VKQLIDRAAGSTFLRHNLIFFTGSTVVSVLNYLYYPVLGRLLPTSDFGSVVPFIILAFTVFVGIPATLSTSFLQGMKRFGALAWSNIVPAASKLGLSVVFVLLGMGTNGALLGLAASQLINLAYTAYLSAKAGRPRLRLGFKRADLQLVRPELGYAGLVFVASLSINVLLSIDIVAVKHWFSPHEAGLYAGIATIARIIFFLTGPLTAVLIASVKLGDARHNRALLKRSAGLLALLGGSALAFFALFPAFTITLLLGRRYLEFAPQLPGLSLAIFILSAANLLLFYHLMLRRYQVVGAAVVSLATMVVLLTLHHESIPIVVGTLIEGAIITFILVVVASLRPKPRREKLSTSH
jgi:O-antigen/teichoic acid export membrane protein